MRARARIVAECDGAGGTRLTSLHGEAPLLPRRTGPRSGPAQVHLVGGAAGPLRGDELLIEVVVGAGARLCVRTVAASIVLGGRSDVESQTTVRASVGAGGELLWLPEPVVATAGCRHVSRSTVELAAGARLTWREELVCGRTGEEPGNLRLVTAVRQEGRPLSTQELAVGPSAPGWSGPAVLGGHRAAGTVLFVDPAWAGVAPTDRFAPADQDASGTGDKGFTGTGDQGSAGTRDNDLAGTEDRPSAGTGDRGLPGTGAGALLGLAGPAVLASAVAPDAYRLRCWLDELAGRLQRHRSATAASSR